MNMQNLNLCKLFWRHEMLRCGLRVFVTHPVLKRLRKDTSDWMASCAHRLVLQGCANDSA